MSEDKFNLSRRKALAALGTIGVASAGAGLGTSAYFSDQETFENNQLTAGTLDMKVAATEYYSDWSSDEAEYAGMASDADSTDIRLPPGEDQSDAQAIALDLDDDYSGQGDVYGAFFDAISSDSEDNSYNTVNGGVAAATGDAEETSEGLCGTGSDADGPMIIDIGDVKPGDFGGAQFAFELCDNPGYVWLTGDLRDASENGVTEPEADDPDEDQVEGSGNPDLKDDESSEKTVELLDEIQVAYSVGAINDDPSGFTDNNGFEPVEQYSLREFLDRISDGPGEEFSAGTMNAEAGGGTGDQGCFAGSPENGSEVHQVSVVWWLPINHGNQVQSDSVSFDLGFYTEQCRHNDGSGMPTADVETGSGFPEADLGDFTRPSPTRARARNGGANTEELAIGSGSNPFASGNRADVDWAFPIEGAEWTLSYDSGAGEAAFEIAGTTVTQSSVSTGDFDGRLLVTAKADEATVGVSNLALSVGGSSVLLNGSSSIEATNDGSDRDIQYAVIDAGVDGSEDFELSGTASVSKNDGFSGDEGWAIDVFAE